jgi:hypothetical protein
MRIILLFIVLAVAFANRVSAANKYWVSSVTSNFSNAANWSLTPGPGGGGAGVPTAADVVVFDNGGAGTCNLDMPLNVAGINLRATYTGTVNVNGFAVTVGSSNALFTGGTFNGGTGILKFNGTFTINGADFISTSNALTTYSTVTLSSGTFNHNAGTFSMTPAVSSTVNVTGSFVFYNLSLSSNYADFRFANPNVVNNNFTTFCSPGRITVNTNTLSVYGTTILSRAPASAPGDFYFNTGTINAYGDVLVNFTGNPYYGDGIINLCGTGTQTLSTNFYTPVMLPGEGKLSNVTIDKPSGRLYLSGDISVFGTWKYIRGSVDAIMFNSTNHFLGGNTAVIDGQGTSGVMQFNNVTLGDGGAGTTTLAGDLSIAKTLLLTAPTNTALLNILNATSNNYSITIGGNLDGLAGTEFWQGNSTVIFTGASAHTCQLGSATAINTKNVFYNLLVNASGGVTLLTNNAVVINNLNLLTGEVNLNNLSLTVGKSTTVPGSLSQTNGWVYGGALTRWFNTSVITIPSSVGLFPIGWSGDYCPFWVGSTSAFTAGGSVTLAFSYAPGRISPFSMFMDNTWAGGTFVTGVSKSYWTVTTANGFAGTGNTIAIRHGGSDITFGINALADINSCLTTTTIATYAPTTNINEQMEVNRLALNTSLLNNTFRIGTRDLVNSPLPIELLDFSAELNNDQVNLTWKTASEKSNVAFTVEKSKDGISFEKVADVASTGNSNTIRAYSEIDVNPYAGLSYYRLKQQDVNSAARYFPMKDVFYEKEIVVTVFPNPSSGNTIMLSLENSVINDTLHIFNTLGQLILSKSVNTADGALISVEVDIPAGVYFIEPGRASGKHKPIQFIKL